MVIITDASGNIQAPTIPENVYQGSNLANEIVFLAPLAQSNVATITFRLPNGELLEERPMTPYTDVPSEYNLSGWRVSLDDTITQYYGQVTFQIYVYGASGNIWYLNNEPVVTDSMLTTISFKSKSTTFNSIQTNGTKLKYGGVVVYDGTNWTDLAYKEIVFNETPTGTLLTWLRSNAVAPQPTTITSVAGTFPVLRGVPRIPHSQPSQASWNEICSWISTINASLTDIENKIDNNWLESKGVLPYDSTFTYSLGVSVFNKSTKTIYTSLKENNLNHSLSDTEWWGKTVITGTTPTEVQEMIDSSIATHNSSATAHQDIRNLIAGKQDQLSQTQLDAVNSGIDSTKVAQIATNTGDISTINGKIPAEASSSNKMADRKWVSDNYVPITFASRLYLSKTGADTADLVNTAPTPSATNTLVVTSTNTTFDWSTPTLTITRTLETAIQLNNTNSFAVDLYFDLSRNTELTFGAKIKVSTDNGTTWSYISSNQSFGEKAYNSGFNSEDIVVYTDLATNETYPIGTLVAIELFKKQEHNSSLTTTYYCGVEIDGANVYSFVEFNFANTRINTNQIEDGAVTYDKLSPSVQEMIADPLPSHTGADAGKVLSVNVSNQIVWDYPADEFVMFTKTNSSGTLTVTSDDWVKAMNNDKAILRVTDGTDYYVLYKVKYDATTVYFEGDGKEAQFIKSGTTYSGTFDNTSGGVFKALTLTSTTLTADQVTTLQNYNVVLQSDITLGSGTTLHAQTILTRPFSYSNTLRGLYIDNSKVGTYLIDTNTNTLGQGAQDIVLNGIAQINGKAIPSYPNDNTKTYILKYVNGTITWVEDNIPTAMTNAEIDTIMDAILI